LQSRIDLEAVEYNLGKCKQEGVVVVGVSRPNELSLVNEILEIRVERKFL